MKVYLIGIGGIGMSAIARFYKMEGCRVAGYDRTPSGLTEEMEKSGIEIHYDDNPQILKEFLASDTDDCMIIYTPAVPHSLKEFETAASSGVKMIKRSRALGEICTGKKCYAVAGTHGKTGTSTMTAHIFTSSGKGCTAFLGGISKNYHSNLILEKSENIIAEADEFDRSFLQLYPQAAVITATDADHLDIYGNIGSLRNAFSEFASQINEDGRLILKKGVIIDETAVKAEIKRYGIFSGDGEAPDFHAFNIRKSGLGEYLFDLCLDGNVITDCTLGIPGEVNIENAVAAAALAWTAGISGTEIKKALASFCGVSRRFDVRHKGRLIYIDDYAHHPAELEATIKSVKAMYPDKKITGIFQPHLFSRTRDFATDFAKALSMLDRCVLMEIYPAREEPIPGITSSMLAGMISKIKGEEIPVMEKDSILKMLENDTPEVLVTFGAGNIDRLVPEITDIYDKKENAL